MDGEMLLRLTLRNLDSSASQFYIPKPQGNTPTSPMPSAAFSGGIRSTFIQHWTGQLYRTISDRTFFYNTLLFFMPGHWCISPCDTKNFALSEDDSDLAPSSALTSEEQQAHGKSIRRTENPLLQHLEILILYLQPKLPRQQLWWDHWLEGLDPLLGALQTYIAQLYSLFFKTFCDVDKALSNSKGKHDWQPIQHSYAAAVCELCSTIELKLISLVAYTIADNMDACRENTMLHLFLTPETTNPDQVAHAMASLLHVKLGAVASVAAENTSFLKLYPGIEAALAVSEERREKSLVILRKSTSAYVERLLEHGVKATRVESHPSEVSRVPPTSSLARPEKVILNNPEGSSFKLRPVSANDALALTTVLEGEEVFSPATTFSVPIGDFGKSKYNLTQEEQQRRTMTSGIPGERKQREAYCGDDVLAELRTPDTKGARVQKSSVSVEKQLPGLEEDRSQPGSKDPSGAAVFCKRLQRKLDLDEASLTHAMTLCSFPSGFPYPNVTLRDLDVCNNDRMARTFVDEIRPLLASKRTAATEAGNAVLFHEACRKYGMQLWEKTVTIREALPFLPDRVGGVLLGRMFTALRTDKQFESLRKIHAQLSQVSAKASDARKNDATLAHTEVLLLKRAEALAHAVNAADHDRMEEKYSQLPSSSAPSALRSEYQEESLLRKVVEDTIMANKGLYGSTRSYTDHTKGVGFLKLFSPISTTGTPSQPQAAEVVTDSGEGAADEPPANVSAGTRLADVYREACLQRGVNPSPSLLQKLTSDDSTFFSTLDLPKSYAGLRSLRPVLDLLCYNGEHLVSLSLCNNNLESDDIGILCSVLLGPPGTNLAHLNLSHNPFTNAAFTSLRELLLSLASLTTLVTEGTRLSPDAARKLQDILEKKMLEPPLQP